MARNLLIITLFLTTASYGMKNALESQKYDYEFYQAALRGEQEDLLFLEKSFNDYSIHALKQVLHAKKVGKQVPIYVHAMEDYYYDDAFEPFSVVLKKFPTSTAQKLKELLQQQIESTIESRSIDFAYGTGELEWLKEELESLKNL